ncbi:MAG: D-aminoacyl-tRNA deacylase [Gammaproteobacteria bacterium]|nr:D-aminoacyl-tRNA deacylase [Gammaproteobacteria bacterium]
MIALLQRVTSASVSVENETVAAIGAGLLVYVALQPQDDETILVRMGERVLAYRVFADDADRMNLGVEQAQGEVLLVPQFTLAASTRKGLRASFSQAASPERAKVLFERFADHLKSKYGRVKAGVFGAHMQVQSVNDGPVTFWLQL